MRLRVVGSELREPHRETAHATRNSSLTTIRKEIRAAANPDQARVARSFFKTGPGQYGEGDRFLGIRVPVLRTMARKCAALPLREIDTLLQSQWHEERLVALLLMVGRFERDPEAIYDLYLRRIAYVNNWDLVDSSAPHIVGAYLSDKDRAPLYELSKSSSLWERRIAILTTHYYIRRGDFRDALAIAAILLDDTHDLIHKAVGWMLREIGNRDRAAEETFLRKHAVRMPRTMLRYAIEKLPTALRAAYLSAGRD